MGIRIHCYETVEEMVAACDAAWHQGERTDSISRASFLGRRFRDWNAAKVAASAPWQEGLDLVQEMIYELDKEGHSLPVPTDIRRRRSWSEDTGDEFDLDRARASQAAWQSSSRQDVRAPRALTILCDVCAPARRRAEEILWRGAASIVLADLLERAGYRVEIIACEYASRAYVNADDCFQSVTLKRSSQPLDLPSLINAVSGWFYRSIIFQAHHTDSVRPDSGYGWYRPLTERPDLIESVCQGSAPVVVSEVWDRSAALDLVRRTLQSLQTA